MSTTTDLTGDQPVPEDARGTDQQDTTSQNEDHKSDNEEHEHNDQCMPPGCW
ncbi:hypothetical protein ACFQ1S_19830 [Kibdelosporangium lantanae]|uniref:Uncharacterized protein n=1 Tax=Kibdelosporangium lantanae TaxID=1497396 RepID=A0ABW3MA41_9PSEU